MTVNKNDAKDSLGSRMKYYEKGFAAERLMPLIPVVCRLDGVAFHTFTRGLNRPYDGRLSKLMIDTTKYLVQLTNARVGYTQSDEISLLWLAHDFESQIYFDAKVTKILSVLASRCSVFFNSMLKFVLPEKAVEEPVFDCRVWNVPSVEEAANAILWREKDATRNSISMAAQALYSHAELQGKSSSEMQEMIFQKGINWNDYPPFFKRGTFIQKRLIERAFTSAEIDKLPPKHAARTNTDLRINRTDFAEIYMPSFGKVTNRTDVLFYGADPITESNMELS